MSSQFIIFIVVLIVALVLGYEWRKVAAASGEEQIVLFSALEGRVIKNGKPLSNALLIREWDFAEDSVRGKDEATTDQNGYFHFSAVFHSYKPPILLVQQMVISQMIRVQSNGREWEAWVSSKHNKWAGTERSKGPVEGLSPDVPLQVTIDLDSKMALRGGVAGHTFFDAPR